MKKFRNIVQYDEWNRYCLYSNNLTKLTCDSIQMAFAPMKRGVAASTTIKGNHAVIKINLLQFISWDDHMRGTNRTKMGMENTTHIFESILKSYYTN